MTKDRMHLKYRSFIIFAFAVDMLLFLVMALKLSVIFVSIVCINF